MTNWWTGVCEAGGANARGRKGKSWHIARLRLVVAVGLAVVGIGMLTAVGWADPPLASGKAHPFVFVTDAEVDAARKALRVRRPPPKLEAFRLQQERANRWLKYSVPRALPFDRQYGDAARDLALVYVVKRDDIYAVQAAAILRALAGKMGTEQRSALHMAVHSLPLVFALDLLTPYLGPEAASLQHRLLDPIVRSLLATPRHSPSTHAVWANAAVAAIGFLREDPSLIEWAVFDPNAGVLRQLDEGILADGIWHERAVGYHFYTLQAFLVVAEAMARSGMALDLYAWTSPQGRSLQQMFVSPLGLLDPTFTLPGSGDALGTSKIQQFWHYLFGWRRYGHLEFAWILAQAQRPMFDPDVFATAGTLFNDRELPGAANPPEAPSQAYPDAGWMSLRSLESRDYWQSDAVQVLLSYGGGETHDHADKLNLDIAGLAERLIEDKSVFAYGDGGVSPEHPERSRHHLWDRQTVAHSTVVVDQRSQLGAQSMFQATHLRGIGEVFVRCGPVKVARASADTVYPGVQYARQVALVGSEYVVDLFRVESETAQVYDWVLHVNRAPQDLPRTDLTWGEAPPFPDSDGYQLIRNLRTAHTTGPWSLEWPKLKLWMAGGMPTQVFLGEGYGGPITQQGVWQVVEHPEPSRTPMILARREVARTVFAAVLELFQGSPVITRVEAVAAGAGLSALRIARPQGVDLVAARWARGAGGAAVVDPVTPLAVPLGASFTLAQVRDGQVHIWADGGDGAADGPEVPGPGGSPSDSHRVVEHHQCVNELPGPRLP